MRDFLNGILTFIGAESLTDLEFNSLSIEDQVYDEATYVALSGVLTSRESVSVLQNRLNGFFIAKGVSVSPAVRTSNIYIGSVL